MKRIDVRTWSYSSIQLLHGVWISTLIYFLWMFGPGISSCHFPLG